MANATCRFCFRQFTNDQATKAHLRHCRAYHATLPKAESLKPGLPKARGNGPTNCITRDDDTWEVELPRTAPARPGRDSHDSLLRLLNIREEFETFLFPKCEGHCLHARLTACVRSNEEAGEEEWAQVYGMLESCYDDVLDMVRGLRLNQHLLFNIYTAMLTVQREWLRYRYQHILASSNPDETDEEEKQRIERELVQYGIREEESRLHDVLLDIKQLLVSARPS